MITLPRRRTVADVMTRRVHIASPDTPFKLLVRLIEENRVSAVPIVDQAGRPVGIVSESDLLTKERRSELSHGKDVFHFGKRRELKAKADALIASELMTSPPITVKATLPLADAARLMQERNVRRLVVVDEQGRIAGIVSRSDILQVFLRTDEDLRHEIRTMIVPAMLPALPEDLHVAVRWNVVTLSGEVDRRSDAEILVRKVADVDGVVSVIDKLSFRWDDMTRAGEPVLAANTVLSPY